MHLLFVYSSRCRCCTSTCFISTTYRIVNIYGDCVVKCLCFSLFLLIGYIEPCGRHVKALSFLQKNSTLLETMRIQAPLLLELGPAG